MPELIAKCVKTHKLPGYEHQLCTLDNCARPKYVAECIEAKQWAKAADYLRIYYLFHHGGIYLDADVEVLKPFDDLLEQQMFVGEEENHFVSNAIIGSVAHHAILADFLGKVDRNFIGSGDLIFQPGMYLWTEIVRYSKNVRIYPPEYFLPYNHHQDVMKKTENSYTIHYFSKSWLKV